MSDWSWEVLDLAKIKEEGLKHTYKSNLVHYVGVMYPYELGPLMHIYSSNSGRADLLNYFNKKVIKKENKKFYLYNLPEGLLIDEETYEFLWKDK